MNQPSNSPDRPDSAVDSAVDVKPMLLFSQRKAIAEKLGVPMDATFNAIVREVCATQRAAEPVSPDRETRAALAEDVKRLAREAVHTARNSKLDTAITQVNALHKAVDRLAAQPTTDSTLLSEARKLAIVLRGMTQCPVSPDNLWSEDQLDADPFMARAAEMLELFSSVLAAPATDKVPTNAEDAAAGNVNAIRHLAYSDGYRDGKAAAPEAPGTQDGEAKRGARCEVKDGGQWFPARFIATDLIGGEPIIQRDGSMPTFATWGTVRGLRPVAPEAPAGEITRPYGHCSITGPAEDVSFVLRHLPDVDDAPEATETPSADQRRMDAAVRTLDRLGYRYQAGTWGYSGAEPERRKHLHTIIERLAELTKLEARGIKGQGERDFIDRSPVMTAAQAISAAAYALHAAPEATEGAQGEAAFHGFMDEENCCVHICYTPDHPGTDGKFATAYYTAPQARKRVTEAEIKAFAEEHERAWVENDEDLRPLPISLARAILAHVGVEVGS